MKPMVKLKWWPAAGNLDDSLDSLSRLAITSGQNLKQEGVIFPLTPALLTWAGWIWKKSAGPHQLLRTKSSIKVFSSGFSEVGIKLCKPFIHIFIRLFYDDSACYEK